MAAKKGTKRVSGAKSEKAQEVLLTILGSGPAVAKFDSIIAANQADGLMYANAVHQQQMTNALGMAVMAKCVQVMLTPAFDPPKAKKKRQA